MKSYSNVKIMGKTTSLRVAQMGYTRCATALHNSVCRSATFLSCSTAHTTVRAVARFRLRRTEACAPLTKSEKLLYGSRSCGAQLRNWCRQVAQLDLVALWLVTPARAGAVQYEVPGRVGTLIPGSIEPGYITAQYFCHSCTLKYTPVRF